MTPLQILVPTFNESAEVVPCVQALLREGFPVTVVDGGSTDDTVARARGAGVSVLEAPRGLAAQINHAVSIGEADAYFVVAADSRPGPGWGAVLKSLLKDPYVTGAGFRLVLDEGTWFFRLIAWGGNFRAHYLGATLPDQGLLFRRNAFLEAGGLRADSPIPYLDLCRALGRAGEFRLVAHPMVSSTRKWRQGGVWRTTLRHQRIFWQWRQFCRQSVVP